MVKLKQRRLFTSADDNKVVDRISVLPNETLGLILSSLTFKEAVRTSTLSRRWRHAWALTRKLHLDGTMTSLKVLKRLGNLPRDHQKPVVYAERCKYLRWVDRLITTLTLMHHDHHHCNLEEFRVLFDLSASHKQWIDDWLSYAVGKKAKTLELNLISCVDEDRSFNTYSFPYKEGNFPSNLRVLRDLSLHLVNVSGATVELFLGNCLLLERVSISESQELLHLEVIRTSPWFKCLEISSCNKLRSVVVRSSNVACFKYGGDSIRRFELVDVPFLTQLWIQPLSPYRFKSVVTMFSSVFPQLQMLKVYVRYNISWEECARTVRGVEMSNLKELVVSINGCYGEDWVSNSLLPVINFTSVSTRLQRFVVEASSHGKGVAIADCGRFSRDSYYRINARKNINLKEMEFIGYRGAMSQFELIRHVAGNFKTLDKIVIDPRGFKIKPHRPWDRVVRLDKVKDESIARAHAKDELRTYVPSYVNLTIL